MCLRGSVANTRRSLRTSLAHNIMSKRIPNGIGLRREQEAGPKAISLNASGSYVLASFDADEYARVQKLDFGKMRFGDEDFVVVARGTKGSLVRFAKLTEDRKYARYLGGKFVSIALIDGEVYTKAEFVRSLAECPTLRVSHAQKEYLGVLHGSRDRQYKSLIYPVSDRFLYLDLEEKTGAQFTRAMVQILAVDPPEAASVKADLLARFS